MTLDSTLGTGPSAQVPASARRLGDLFGALLLHLPLAVWTLVWTAYFAYLGGLAENAWLIYLGGGAAIWLALAALLVKWWANGRPGLWEVPLAWLLLASLQYLAWPLLFWPRCRRWLIRSCLPWHPSPRPGAQPRAVSILRVAAVFVLPAVLMFGPIAIMYASGVAGTRTYEWRNVTFSYPAEFRQAPAAQTHPPEAQIEAAFFSYLGDNDSGLIFQVLEWDSSEVIAAGDISDEDWDELAGWLESETGFPELARTRIAGLPAFRATDPIAGRSFTDAEISRLETWILDVDAHLVYVVGAQYKGRHRTEVEDAYDEALSTFELEQ